MRRSPGYARDDGYCDFPEPGIRMHLTRHLRFTVLACCFGTLLGVIPGCVTRRIPVAATDARWQDARQMVLVVTPDWNSDHGELRTFERSEGRWRMHGQPVPVTVGKAGTAWGIGLHPPQSAGPIKREGDGRAPAGVFAIGEAFGYAADAKTALPYAQMQDTSWCVDVVDSPLYNRIVDTRIVGESAVRGSSEPMRRDLHLDGDQRYLEGFIIQHNPDGRKDAGSCIFAHIWKLPGASTAGCTAMAVPVMQHLYAWLQPAAHPVFVLLPRAQYDRLKTAWNLPSKW